MLNLINLLNILKDSRRWKNSATYVSLLTYIPSVFALFNVTFLPDQWLEIENTIKAIIALLTAFGFFVDPTTKGYTDKEVK